MYSLGADFVPPTIYAGGLRYHGASPSLSLLINKGRIKSDEVSEEQVKDALKIFANTQGIIAAPFFMRFFISSSVLIPNPYVISLYS